MSKIQGKTFVRHTDNSKTIQEGKDERGRKRQYTDSDEQDESEIRSSIFQ